MTDVAQWLESIGLGQYAELFAENAIDIEVLPELAEPDLEKLGLPLGHRKKLLKAIRDLGTTPVRPTEPASAPATTPAAIGMKHRPRQICST